uniref:CW-type domain-containing protein n=1 Tax=Solanum lycopersicum TaxID=4081 RepID=A0A3Q7HP27_SOLLC
MAEEHETEEGEIYDDLVYSYSDVKIPKEEDEVEEGEIHDDYHIDIDVKIQTVLGEYMKDFEGAENLGPTFGVYGSFLASDQLVIQPQISQKLPSPTPISSHKPIRIKFRSSDKTAAPKSSDSPPPAPFIIQEDWIQCSTCRKRRLLPYGTKPNQLSQSWVCTMLDWLPGMSCCDISEDHTTTALHALYHSLIQINFQNRGASTDVKAHNGREVSVKKRKSREQDYLGNKLGESDANAFERKLRKQNKSKVIQAEKKKSTRSGKSTRRDRGIKDCGPIEREQQATTLHIGRGITVLAVITSCFLLNLFIC